LRQILNAVIYLHKRGVVHRDLKPENLLLSLPLPITSLENGNPSPRSNSDLEESDEEQDNKEEAVDQGEGVEEEKKEKKEKKEKEKENSEEDDTEDEDSNKEDGCCVSFSGAHLLLADFGVACIISDKEPSITKPIGTPGYIAPEIAAVIIHRSGSYSKEIDLWAIGVIMYILLCGFPPFDIDDEDLLINILRGKITFPSPHWDNVSDLAKDLVQQFLTVNPTERITAKEALQHPWFSEEELPTEELSATLNELKQFKAEKFFGKLQNTLSKTLELRNYMMRRKKKDTIDMSHGPEAREEVPRSATLRPKRGRSKRRSVYAAFTPWNLGASESEAPATTHHRHPRERRRSIALSFRTSSFVHRKTPSVSHTGPEQVRKGKSISDLRKYRDEISAVSEVLSADRITPLPADPRNQIHRPPFADGVEELSEDDKGKGHGSDVENAGNRKHNNNDDSSDDGGGSGIHIIKAVPSNSSKEKLTVINKEKTLSVKKQRKLIRRKKKRKVVMDARTKTKTAANKQNK